MPTIVERRQERGTLIEQARKIQDAAEALKRSLTTDEKTEQDRLFAASDVIAEDIKRQERLEANEAEMRAVPTPGTRPTPTPNGEGRAVMSESVRAMINAAAPEHRAMLEVTGHPGYRAAFRNYLRGDFRANDFRLPAEYRGDTLQVDIANKGGYLVTPLEMATTMLKNLDDAVVIRAMATKFALPNAISLGVPNIETDLQDADWTSELATGQLGTMTFGRRELTPHPLAKRVKVSKKLLRASTIDVEALVRERMTYKFALTEEKAFLTGDGNNKPLGVFTASADGISTARDVSTDNTTTAMTADGLIEAKHFLKSQYWKGAAWIFSRTGLKLVRKLKNGSGDYIWAPGLTGGIPDSVLDSPYHVSEHVPATFTTGLYVGIYGDFSYYWIADALDMQIQRLDELYAETNETGFIGRRELDGAPVLEEAFVRIRLA